MTKFDDATGDWTDGLAPLPAAQADPWKRPEMPSAAHTEQPAPAPIRTEGLSIASLWCSIVGVFTVAPAILGIVFGFVARSRIKKSEGSLKGSGLALSGIWVGTAVLVFASVLIVAATFGGTESDGSIARQELLPAASYPTGWESMAGTAESDMSYYAGEIRRTSPNSRTALVSPPFPLIPIQRRRRVEGISTRIRSWRSATHPISDQA